MDVLTLIKGKKAIRKYKDLEVPKEILDAILEAGLWGPSIIGRQPWFFVVINSKEYIGKIKEVLVQKAKRLNVGARVIFNTSIKVIESASVMILAYNDRRSASMAKGLGLRYSTIAKIAEISAVSAAIQNMMMVAESLGIGSCWLGTPVFCEKTINKLVGVDESLLAAITLGYPDEDGIRSKRKVFEKTIKYLI